LLSLNEALQIEIDIEATDTIRRIKERVEEKQGIQPDQQKYVCCAYVCVCVCVCVCARA
jgi:hypothetical protein